MTLPSDKQAEKLEVLNALAESVRQAELGELKEARPAIRALLGELDPKTAKGKETKVDFGS
jgi:hypothetical protein